MTREQVEQKSLIHHRMAEEEAILKKWVRTVADELGCASAVEPT